EDVVRLALEFGVSYESVVHRLQKFRRVTSQQKAALLQDRAAAITPEFRQRRLVVQEQLPSDYFERALRAYANWKISFRRLVDLLHLRKDEVEVFREFLREQELLRDEDDSNGRADVPPPAPVESR